MNAPDSDDPQPQAPLGLRSGTAARLAGLPVTTLRVWERRYGVVNAARSQTGRRIYSQLDVARLRLLRGLTNAGHAIGTIARLELAALQALADGMPNLPNIPRQKDVNAVIVGRRAAHALEATPGCVLQAVHDDLDEAEQTRPPEIAADMLVVRLPSLQPAAITRILALGANLRAGAIFVIYAFATDATELALREAGVTARREPVTDRELAHWVHSAQQASSVKLRVESMKVPPREFGDEALMRLAKVRSSVSCECVRHMADIVTQLVGFERYSRECIAAGHADAALHRRLAHTAGAARTLFEQPLKDVVADRGLRLDESGVKGKIS